MQNFTVCTPASAPCYKRVADGASHCMRACTGLYADIGWTEGAQMMEDPKLVSLQEEYTRHKAARARNIELDMDSPNGGW